MRCKYCNARNHKNDEQCFNCGMYLGKRPRPMTKKEKSEYSEYMELNQKLLELEMKIRMIERGM